jgi:hypothetical protein
MTEQTSSKKCYNSWACVLSVLIIIFLLGSVIYDMTCSKPKMRKSIKQIEVQVQEINSKMDTLQSVYFIEEAAKMGATIAK